MNGHMTYRQEGRTANIGFAKCRVQCIYDSFVQGSGSVFQLNICAKNPPLRKAENRYLPFKKTDSPNFGWTQFLKIWTGQ